MDSEGQQRVEFFRSKFNNAETAIQLVNAISFESAKPEITHKKVNPNTLKSKVSLSLSSFFGF
jgi:hypothetical protein